MAEFADLLKQNITFIPYDPPLGPAVLNPHDIAVWENIVNSPFPRQYREYLLHCNGGGIRISPKHEHTVDGYSFDVVWPQEIKGLTPGSLLNRFFTLRDIQSLPPKTRGDVLTFEYVYNAWKEHLPPDTFPIATDPGGNLILIGLKGENAGKICYWLLETADAMETPEIASYAYLGKIADSFVDFILSLKYVDW